MVAKGSLFGYEVRSAYPLQRLLSASGPRGSLELRVAPDRFETSVGTVVHSSHSHGLTFTLTRVQDTLHATCSLTGGFVIDAPAGVVSAAPRGAPREHWEHRMVATAFPLLLAERGDLVMHAAAVESGGRAIVFAGPPRRGKSTLAATGASIGYRVLAEDGAAIEFTSAGAIVWPGPCGIRVAGDVAHGLGLSHKGPHVNKRTVFLETNAHSHDAVPLGALVLLGDRGTKSLQLDPVDAAAAVPSLIPSLIFGGSDRLANAFRAAARVASLVPIYRCRFPDGLTELRAHLGRVIVELSTGSASVSSGATPRSR